MPNPTALIPRRLRPDRRARRTLRRISLPARAASKVPGAARTASRVPGVVRTVGIAALVVAAVGLLAIATRRVLRMRAPGDADVTRTDAGTAETWRPTMPAEPSPAGDTGASFGVGSTPVTEPAPVPGVADSRD